MKRSDTSRFVAKGGAGLHRFDYWAMRLSAGLLLWITAVYFLYLLSPEWLGTERQAFNLQLTVALLLGFRGALYLIDLLRGRGAYLTRLPWLAFIDMLALGALVIESYDEEISSLLAPLFLVFLALVPILYRNIRGRRLHAIFSILLALEAVALIIPRSALEVDKRYNRHMHDLESQEIKLKALGDPPPVAADKGRNLNDVVREVPGLSVSSAAVRLASLIEEAFALVEKTVEGGEVALTNTLGNLDSAVRTSDNHRLYKSELDGTRAAVAELARDVKELQRKLEAHEVFFGEVERAARVRVDYAASRLANLDAHLEGVLHRLEIRYFKKLTNPTRRLVDLYGGWMPIVLGFLVQFQIRRFVNRRIETERSRTLSEMQSERHRMDAQNWINLTAGLTHNIGNEVRGYDVFLEEITEWLESGVVVPADIRAKVQFIYGTNQARLGFIQFLREFALLKQVFEEVRPVPRGLRPIALERAIRSAHARVQSIETSYNPPDSTDPGDIRKRRKFLETPLEINSVGGRPITLVRGREAVLDFFFYELIKNALRNCSGRMPLIVSVQRVSLSGAVELCFINDLQVEFAEPGVCPTCRRDSSPTPLAVMSVHGKNAECCNCLRAKVEDTLLGCFYPGRGSGTGLGLFVIKHFLEEYYYGLIHTGIESWDPEARRFMVYFRLVVPDDLTAAIDEKNAMWSAAT